jgi:hypothetical protein
MIMRFARFLFLVVYACGFSFNTQPHCKGLYKSVTAPYGNDYFQPCYVRAELLEIVDHLNFTTGVEIGVQQGLFAETSLSIWKKAEMYALVDIWRKQEATYADSANVEDAQQEENFRATKLRLAKFGNKPVYYRNKSSEAVQYFKDNSLDYIYLDALHDYCGVTEDLNNWWPKLKIGGIMAGHDFLSASEALQMSRGVQHFELCLNGTIHSGAVKGAVVDFACNHNLIVHHTRDKPVTWYFSRKTLHN